MRILPALENLMNNDINPFKGKFMDWSMKFFENVVSPNFDRLEKRGENLENNVQEIKENDKKVNNRLDSIDPKLDLVIEKVTDNDKQISRLKAAFSS